MRRRRFNKRPSKQGGIDFATLNTLVSKAENLQTAIKKNFECAQPGNKQFVTSITGIIFDLAEFALGKPELFTTGELNRLAMAALGVGAMGSGAADPQAGAELLSKFAKEFTDRLSDAETGKDCMEATQMKLAGLALNNAALKQQAGQVMTAVCRGGSHETHTVPDDPGRDRIPGGCLRRTCR